jgi:hypothetical protein
MGDFGCLWKATKASIRASLLDPHGEPPSFHVIFGAKSRDHRQYALRPVPGLECEGPCGAKRACAARFGHIVRRIHRLRSSRVGSPHRLHLVVIQPASIYERRHSNGTEAERSPSGLDSVRDQ